MSYATIRNVRLLVCVAVVLGFASCDSALASQTGSIELALNGDGSGAMVANLSTGHEGEMWSWQICAEDGWGCTPFGGGQVLDTGDAPPNSVFRATETIADVSVRSRPWHGDVAAATPPSVSGEVRANALVTPVRGTWKGGWDGDFDRTQLAACSDSDGTGCTTLTDSAYGQGCPHEAAVIDPAFTGRYLLVADQTYGPDTEFADIAISSPYGGSAWAPGPTISVAIVGQIAPASGPRQSECGPPPLAAVPPGPNPSPSGPDITKSAGPGIAEPPRPTHPPASWATLSAHGVATIHCRAACRIVLRAHRRKRYAHRLRTLPAQGTVIVRLSKRALGRLGRGPATLSVDVNGAELARRTVNVGQLRAPANARSSVASR